MHSVPFCVRVFDPDILAPDGIRKLSPSITTSSSEGYRQIETLRDGNILRLTKLTQIEIPIADIPWTR